MDAFKARIDTLIDEVKGSAVSKNVDEVLVPNDKEYRNEQIRKVNGVPLNKVTADELRGFSAKYGIECPF